MYKAKKKNQTKRGIEIVSTVSMTLKVSILQSSQNLFFFQCSVTSNRSKE